MLSHILLDLVLHLLILVTDFHILQLNFGGSLLRFSFLFCSRSATSIYPYYIGRHNWGVWSSRSWLYLYCWVHNLYLDAPWGIFGPSLWCGVSPLPVVCDPLGRGVGGGPGIGIVGLVYHTISWGVRGWRVVRCCQILALPCLCSSFLLNGMLDKWLSKIFFGGQCACCGRCPVGPSLLAISFLLIFGWCW